MAAERPQGGVERSRPVAGAAVAASNEFHGLQHYHWLVLEIFVSVHMSSRTKKEYILVSVGVRE